MEVLHASRSERMTNALLSVSTTPRTMSRYLLELQTMDSTAHREEMIYTEAKVCMHESDVASASSLFDLLPPSYKNVSQYRDQCATFDALCKNGLIERRGLDAMKGALSDLLNEHIDHHDVCRYADALTRNGYNEHTIREVTMYTVNEVVELASMSEGHRQVFGAYAERNTDPVARGWLQLLTSLEQCAPIMACIQTPKRRATHRSKGADAEDDRGEDSRIEATLMRIKATEAILGMAAHAKGDDDSTKGDDD